MSLQYIVLTALIFSLAQCQFLRMNRTGCGDARSGKTCLFRPVGCNPDYDCTLAIIAYPVDSNHLRIEMVAATLIPHVELQYIAIGFSKDPVMGDDFVSECVLSEFGGFSGDISTEVYASYNTPNKLNDRIQIADICYCENRISLHLELTELFPCKQFGQEDRLELMSDVQSQIVDGRLSCMFTQQIVPKAVKNNDGRIWSLNDNYYIFGATGSAQPDEINAHDTQRGSFFYPVMSAIKVNPTQNQLFAIETAAATKFPPKTTSTTTTTTTTTEDHEQATTRKANHHRRFRFNSSPQGNAILSLILSIIIMYNV